MFQFNHNHEGQEVALDGFIKAIQQAINADGKSGQVHIIDLTGHKAKADPLKKAVEPISDSVIGFTLIERHPTLNIGLYSRRESTDRLIVINGKAADFMNPNTVFTHLKTLTNWLDVDQFLVKTFGEKSEDKPEWHTAKFLATYTTIEGQDYLKAIYDLELMRKHAKQEGRDYDALFNATIGDNTFRFADSREAFLKEFEAK